MGTSLFAGGPVSGGVPGGVPGVALMRDGGGLVERYIVLLLVIFCLSVYVRKESARKVAGSNAA